MTEKLAELFDEQRRDASRAAASRARRLPRVSAARRRRPPVARIGKPPCDAARLRCGARRCSALLAVAAAPSARRRQRRAPTPPVAIEIRGAADRGVRVRDPDAPRSSALLEFRGGLVLTSPFEHFGGISAHPRRSPTARASSPLTDRGWWLRGRIVYDGTRPTGDRRRRDGADARRRRPAARGARLVRHRGDRARTAARSTSASSASTRSCASTTARTGCWRAAQPIAVPPAIALAAEQQGHRMRWSSCREGCRSPAR